MYAIRSYYDPEPNVLWGQVGNGGLDHGWWGSAVVYHLASVDRPSYKIRNNFV